MYNCRAVKCLNVYSCLFDKLQFYFVINTLLISKLM